MNENGLKIKKFKAATIYGHELGTRSRYECSDAMLHQLHKTPLKGDK